MFGICARNTNIYNSILWVQQPVHATVSLN